jgi:CBS domain containing-hemolysin-like protein
MSILISCVFSGSETGFITWNPLKVSHAAAQGGFTPRLAMRLMGHRGQLLSSILAGNNICNVASALIFVRLYEQINQAVALDLSLIPFPESIFLTPALLLFSEIIPKSLYRTYPFRLTMKSIPMLAVLFFALTPFFWVLNAAHRIFRRPGERSFESQSAGVREEIVLVALEGAKRGSIFEGADLIMKNTLDMKGKRIESISIPLNDWKNSRAVYRASQMITEFSRDAGAGAQTDEIVVFDDNLSIPIGYVSLLDAAAQRGRGGLKTYASIIKPLPRISSGTEILTCLGRLPIDSPRYHLILDGGTPVGILDKMELYGTAFAA